MYKVHNVYVFKYMYLTFSTTMYMCTLQSYPKEKMLASVLSWLAGCVEREL